jgi:hypothetical protein
LQNRAEASIAYFAVTSQKETPSSPANRTIGTDTKLRKMRTRIMLKHLVSTTNRLVLILDSSVRKYVLGVYDSILTLILEKKGGGEDVDWIHLPKDRKQWWVHVNTVMSLRVPYQVRNF